MLKWRMSAANHAVHTACGDRAGAEIRSTGRAGCLLYGPYVDLPAGRLTARIRLAQGASGPVHADLAADDGNRLLATVDLDARTAEDTIELTLDCPEPLRRVEVRLGVEETSQVAVTGIEFDLEAWAPERPTADRRVGEESRKTYPAKIATGFIDRYLSGTAILEIGFRGYRDEVVVPIVPQAIGVDLGYPGYDGVTLPFADGSIDAIYSSHCLEHIADYRSAFADWHRLLKIGGYLITAVPHQYLFEKQRFLPSKSNTDHRRYYTPETLLAELREVWPENGYRIRQLIENDTGFDYSRFPEEPSPGSYEIELVVQKIAMPSWRLDDGSVRPYGAAEFQAAGEQTDKWAIVIDFADSNPWKLWGPYARLVPARYVATFCFDADIDGGPLGGDIVLDVAIGRTRAVSRTLSGWAGAEELRGGRIAVPFEVAGAPSHVEFRLFAEGRPMTGRLTFKGVEVQFERADVRMR